MPDFEVVPVGTINAMRDTAKLLREIDPLLELLVEQSTPAGQRAICAVVTAGRADKRAVAAATAERLEALLPGGRA
jgi:hypothetical protein